MTAAPAIKGWCPTLLSPMQSGDGWLARGVGVAPETLEVGAHVGRMLIAQRPILLERFQNHAFERLG